MSKLSAAGISVDLPLGWEGSIQGDGFRQLAHGGAETPLLHAATFPLPGERGTFGAGAVEGMRPTDVFVTLLEYAEGSASTALFAKPGPPTELAAGDFERDNLQRTIPGQSGAQRFFSTGDRAFCLYVVLGSHVDRADLVPSVNEFLSKLSIT